MSDAGKVLVWDRHTRLFHWSLVVLITLSLTTGLSDNLDWMQWHIYSGYGLLGLLVFRLLTGLLGHDYSRFSRFPLTPRSILGYAKGQTRYRGHNPMGAWMIIAMLLVISIQVFSGLLTTDDFFIEGPWAYWANEDWTQLASNIHDLNWTLLAGLIGLHLLAIAVYQFWKKEPLVAAMVTGRKRESSVAVDAARNVAPWALWQLLLAAVCAAVLTWAIINLPAWINSGF